MQGYCVRDACKINMVSVKNLDVPELTRPRTACGWPEAHSHGRSRRATGFLDQSALPAFNLRISCIARCGPRIPSTIACGLTSVFCESFPVLPPLFLKI